MIDCYTDFRFHSYSMLFSTQTGLNCYTDGTARIDTAENGPFKVVPLRAKVVLLSVFSASSANANRFASTAMVSPNVSVRKRQALELDGYGAQIIPQLLDAISSSPDIPDVKKVT